MSNAAEMDAQEIINYIATAPKKTPVKLYVREKPGMKVASGAMRTSTAVVVARPSLATGMSSRPSSTPTPTPSTTTT